MEMTTNNIIEIQHLKRYFKDVKAVDDISFSVKKGELFAFLGLNGAGKSTTINILCGQLDKDSGKIYACGYDLDKDIEKIKPTLGVVFQNSVLDNKLTVLENLKIKAKLYDINNEKFKENLEFLSDKLEFKDILNRPLYKLSGGQKRRIDLARALIHNPQILILDEPTTGLDPKTRILVWELLSSLRKTKELTIILTTHYMEEANEADTIVIIDSGKIVANDTPNNLKNKYANDFLRIYKYDNSLPEILAKDKVKFTQDEKTVEIEVADIEQAKNFIVKYQKLIFDFEVLKGKMDNVFLNITGKDLKEVAYVK